MISCGHHVDTEIEKFFRQRRRDSEARRGIFTVGDNQIRGVTLAQFGQAIFCDRAPGAPEDVTDKKNLQESGLINNAARSAGENVQTSMVPENRAVARAGPSAADFRHWQLGTGNWLLGTDFSRLQEVVIPRRIQGYVPHSARVHEDVIEVPEVS